MSWTNFILGALGASPFIFFVVFMHLLQKQREEDDRLAREFDEEMRKSYPTWGKR